MTRKLWSCLAAASAALACSGAAQAATETLNIFGSGIGAQLTVTYGGSPDAFGGYAVSSVTGYFSDSNIGVSGNVSGIEAVNPVVPLPANVLAPNFSYFFVANGVPSNGTISPALSYDNTFYPGGSPVVCLDYPASGGPLDVYGLLLTLDGTNDVVNIWSNGVFPWDPPGTAFTYGVAVADSTYTYDYQANLVPEASTWAMMGLGFVGLGLAGRRAARRSVAA